MSKNKTKIKKKTTGKSSPSEMEIKAQMHDILAEITNIGNSMAELNNARNKKIEEYEILKKLLPKKNEK